MVATAALTPRKRLDTSEPVPAPQGSVIDLEERGWASGGVNPHDEIAGFLTREAARKRRHHPNPDVPTRERDRDGRLQLVDRAMRLALDGRPTVEAGPAATLFPPESWPVLPLRAHLQCRVYAVGSASLARHRGGSLMGPRRGRGPRRYSGWFPRRRRGPRGRCRGSRSASTTSAR